MVKHVCLDIHRGCFSIQDVPLDIGNAPFRIGDAPFDIGDAPFHFGGAPFDIGGAPFDIEETGGSDLRSLPVCKPLKSRYLGGHTGPVTIPFQLFAGIQEEKTKATRNTQVVTHENHRRAGRPTAASETLALLPRAVGTHAQEERAGLSRLRLDPDGAGVRKREFAHFEEASPRALRPLRIPDEAGLEDR